MSGIIDGELINQKHYQQNSLILSHQHPEDQNQSLIRQKKSILKVFNTFLATFNTQHLIQKFTENSKDQIRFNILFHNLLPKDLTLMVSVSIKLQIKIVQITASLLDEKGPYQIQTLGLRILFCKLYCKSYFGQQNKMTIDLHTGIFKIIRSSFFFFENGFVDILTQQNLQIMVKNTVNDSMKVFRVLLKKLRPNQMISISKNQSELLKRLNRYIIKSPIEPAFDVSFGTGKYNNLQIKTKMQAHLTTQMMNNVVTDLKQFNSHLFYITPDFPIKNLNCLYTKQFFQSNQKEIAFLKERILPPLLLHKLNIFESKYVYNIIEINNLFQINMKKVNVGGFSQISRAEAEFWYMLTVDNEKMQKLENFKKTESFQQKTMNKVKKLNRKQLVFKSSTYRGESGRNRILHEIKIVSKFKGLQSIFLPEYFKVKNEQSPFSQYLIMEYLPHPTLNEYCDINQSTMSFLTKVHLASLIVQGLRFLSSYQLVHMDLKPSNIIVSKRMITKLIDFGQSYHKDVCDKYFKPAFSMPYGSPQVFDGIGKIDFNQKNDVYSWGVIVFEMLFKSLPFFFSRQKASKVFRERIYMDYLYFVPQEEGDYGSFEIMSILRNVIFRSLDTNSVNRPCTIWLTVLLKECLSYLINLEFNNTESQSKI